MNSLEEEHIIEEDIDIEFSEMDDGLTEVFMNDILSEGGLLLLKARNIKAMPKKKDGKYYFGGTLIGYSDEFDRPIEFADGSHEKALNTWPGKKLLLWHEEKMYPLGKFEDAWMDGSEVKFLAWTDNEEAYKSVKIGKMIETSPGMKLKKVTFNKQSKKYRVLDYEGREGSMVNFPGYKGSKIEVIGTDKDKVRNLIMSDEQQIKLQEEKPKPKVEVELVIDTDKAKEELEEFSGILAEKEKEVLKLQKDLLIMKIKEKHPKATNMDEVLALKEKYNMSEEDAEALIVEEEEVVEIITEIKDKEPEGKKLGEDRNNEELPVVAEPVKAKPKEKSEEERFRETLDARVEHAFRRGYN